MAAIALESIVQVIRVLGSSRVQIDTGTFSLHYRATTTVFVALGGLLFTTSLMVSPLQCQPVSDPAPASTAVINAYCWSTSTFSLSPTVTRDTTVAQDTTAGKADPSSGGSGSSSSNIFGSDIDQHRRHSYYSWVSFLLLLQGLLFYLPRWLWHVLEGKQLASILQDTGSKMAENEYRRICLENVLDYLRRTRGEHQMYFYQYIACEALNLANAIGGIFLIDAYLGGGFLNYGPRVLGYSSTGSKLSPMDDQFPKMTGCRISVPGRDGLTRTADAVCILSMNMLYEKVYLLLWFWLVVLAVVSGGSLIYRAVVMPSAPLLAAALRRRAPLADPSVLADLSARLSLGDIFLLSLIAENIDAGIFQELVAELTSAVTKRPAIADITEPPKLVTDNVAVSRRPNSSVNPIK